MSQAAVIRTVRGDILPGDLGVCYAHEHLIGQPPAHLGQADADLVLDSETAAAKELTWFRQAGGRAVVEMSTPDYGRDVAALHRLSEATDVHIITATGFNKEKYSAPYLRDASTEELAALFTHEIRTGVDGTSIRAGVIKVSSTLDTISPLAEKMFRAAARAHRATGASISTHTEAGTMALEQVELLVSEGVDATRIIVGHMDRKLEWETHRRLARTGAYLGFDQISKEKYYPDSLRVEFILQLAAEGHGQQILLGGDLARRSYWPGYQTGGGPGFTYILWRFVPWLRADGLSEAAIMDILVHNPARVLSMPSAA